MLHRTFTALILALVLLIGALCVVLHLRRSIQVEFTTVANTQLDG